MTLQKKLDKLGDKLKRKHEGYQPTDKLDTSNPPKGSEHPHDLIQKGLKYDTLKKRNDELVKLLNDLYKRIQPNALYNEDLWGRAEQLIKNNQND